MVDLLGLSHTSPPPNPLGASAGGFEMPRTLHRGGPRYACLKPCPHYACFHRASGLQLRYTKD